MEINYLRAGYASDFKNPLNRKIFRFFEILPGALSWSTLILVIILSWKKPIWIAVFIILFDLYWLFRTIYFSFHLRGAYQRMKRYEKIDWLRKLDKLNPKDYTIRVSNWRDIYQLIVLPSYKESLQIIRETFKALQNSDYPKDKMIVVLALEERAGRTAKEIGEIITKEFGDKFFKVLCTFHPSNLSGEIAGKGANETWAVKTVKEKVIDVLEIPYQNIIISSLDADTSVFPRYFSCLTFHYLTCKKPFRTSYQPIPLFINNIWEAPSFSRVFSFSSTFWHTMNQERPESLVTFSSHSMSFKTLVEVGFKQTNIIQDDSRIFWQCFLKFNGDYRTKPIYYPVSMDANVSKNIWKNVINIYKQQKRWAYGVGEIPYVFFGFLKNRKISFVKKFFYGFNLLESHWSWATNSIIIFLLGWLPLILGGHQFSQTLISYNLPKITSYILTLAMIGLIGSIYISIVLLPPRPPQYGKFKYLFLILEWLLIPIMMIFFSALPALHAQTHWMLGKYIGFWATEKFRKH